MSEFPQVVVINLERAADRRKMMAEHLDAMGIEHRFQAAVDGKLLTPEQKKLYARSKAYLHLNRDLHPNELGCSLSHVEAWRLAAELDGPLIVLEDDIEVHDDFCSMIEARADWLPADWDVVNFGHDIAKPVNLKPIAHEHGPAKSLCEFEGVVARTGAYMVSPTAARKLLECALPVSRPADDILGDQAYNGLKIYGIVPRIALWRTEDDCPSMIWESGDRQEFFNQSRSSKAGIFFRAYRRLRKLIQGS
ncbi:glycosyltransferase family 25 protein [Cerasicoccus frondis]|uniref:glycosyltransferase family 25 protein n=1 Tax=Cerasicoccus frondis TaxID=490090 RepID=UPI002852B4A7|nr:glycosyltransferase family 25 protein [Cerasicoccus frondis]